LGVTRIILLQEIYEKLRSTGELSWTWSLWVRSSCSRREVRRNWQELLLFPREVRRSRQELLLFP
jgi:hypothetical protein